MSLFDATQLRKYRYVVAECMVIIGSEVIPLEPMYVTGIKIINNYTTDVFPIFLLNLQVYSDLYYKINANKNNMTIRLRIQKYYTKDGKEKKIPDGDYINDEFVLIRDDVDVSRSSDISKAENKIENKRKKSQDDREPKYSMELYLYRKEVSTAMQTQLNIIFKESTLTSAIAWALCKIGIKNMIISPLENTKVYKPLFIPPLTLNAMIMYLDIMYGFYRAGSVLFFGLKRSYLLNYKGGCTAYTVGERKNCTIFVPKQGSNANMQGGTVNTGDTSGYFYNVEYGAVEFSNSSISSDVINGTNAMIINSRDGSITTAESDAITSGSNNKIIMENTTANPWLGDIYAYQSSSSSEVITGTISDCDIEGIEPNKNWSVIFEDSSLTNKYNGKYFLTSSIIDFVNDDGSGDFGVIAGFTLQKIGKPSSTTITMN